MTPDDPRHGSYAGYNAGCRLRCCQDAAARYQRGRNWDHYNGRPRLVPALGTHRRLDALVALGWSMSQVADYIGITRECVRQWRRRDRIYRRSADRVAYVYEQLSMSFPPENTTAEKNIAARMRTFARRRGYAPPLAWDDIDDPSEQPQFVEKRAKGWPQSNVLENYTFLVSNGESHEQAVARLGVTANAIDKALSRQKERAA